jgi:thiol-disulfide isomerase/thioredoxin
MLDVWATWCEPCRESLPQYQALAGKYAARGLRLYALNVDGDAAVPMEIPKFITETKLSVPILLDTDAKLSEETLKVKVMPTALLIDRRGVVRHVHEGFEGRSLAEVVGHLESLLAEP